MCIYLEVGASPASDLSHPEYLTNIPWLITGFYGGFSSSSLIDFSSDQSFVGDSNPLDSLLQEGTWSCCNSQFVFFDDDYVYRCDFIEYDPLNDANGDGIMDSSIDGSVWEGSSEIGWFTMEPFALVSGCLNVEACNFVTAHIHDESACIYHNPSYAFSQGTYRAEIDLDCDSLSDL